MFATNALQAGHRRLLAAATSASGDARVALLRQPPPLPEKTPTATPSAAGS